MRCTVCNEPVDERDAPTMVNRDSPEGQQVVGQVCRSCAVREIEKGADVALDCSKVWSADFVQILSCGADGCGFPHVVLFDPTGEPRAQVAIKNIGFARELVRILGEREKTQRRSRH